MIIVFGSDGFLGDRMVSKLQDACNADSSCGGGSYAENGMPLCNSEVVPFADKNDFFRFLPDHYREVKWVVYCDKRVPNTTLSVFRMEFVQKLWSLAASYSIPLLYAFHQPTESPVSDFQPDTFVQWTKKQYRKPPFWYIFRVGEVYGSREDLFGEFTSRVYLFYRQIVEKGEVVLPTEEPGVDSEGVLRDYLFVQDAVRVFYWFMLHRPANGVYDLGSGFERSDLAVANAIFRALKRPPRIRYSRTAAKDADSQSLIFRPDLHELRKSGYKKPFFSVEKGVKSSMRKPH